MIFRNCYTNEWNLRQFWKITSDVYAKYHVQIMLLVVDTTTHKRFVIFTCRYFKLGWNTTVLRQLNSRNLSCSSIIVVIVMIIMISIGNSMICSDIWRNYHKWYFQLGIKASEIWDNFERSEVVFFAKYHVQIMLLFIYTTAHKRFVIFTCRYSKLSWNTTALSQSNCRNSSCSSIMTIIMITVMMIIMIFIIILIMIIIW